MPVDFMVVAVWFAEGAVNHMGAAFAEQQLSDIGITTSTRDSIKEWTNDAVRRIKKFVHQEFVQDNLNDATGDLQDAVNQIALYKASNFTSEDLLLGATQRVSSATAHLSQIGLPAFEAYAMAVGIQLCIHEQRIKSFGDAEKNVTVVLINEIAIPHVRHMKKEWKSIIKDAGKVRPVPVLTGRPSGSPIPNPDVRIHWRGSGMGIDGERFQKTFERRNDAEEFVDEEVDRVLKELEDGPFDKMFAVTDKWKELQGQYK